MYLTDKQLQARLAEFRFESEDGDRPFDPDEQIGPCSVDLRLSRVYWRRKRTWGRKGPIIDLGKTRLMELDPRRRWERCELREGESIALKPGGMVLGRVAERVEIPVGCAAAIEGRSSFARMGLSVHATGSFINPGWSGRMPLTLVNHGSVELRIPVHTAVCQMMVIPLASPPDKPYPDRMGKYQDDDGGPSYWWRDKAFKNIRASVGGELGSRVLQELDDLLRPWDDDLLERLEDFLHDTPYRAFTNAPDLLDAFSDREKRTRIRTLVTVRGKKAALPTWIAIVSVLAGFDIAVKAFIPIVLIGLVPTIWLTIWGLHQNIGEFLTPERLQALRVEQQQEGDATADRGKEQSGN